MISSILVFNIVAALLIASPVFAAVHFEWQSVDNVPEPGNRARSASLGSDGAFLYFTRCADVTSHFFRIAAGSISSADWSQRASLPILQTPTESGDGMGFYNGYLYMFAEISGNAYREIIRYNIGSDSWETSNTAEADLGSVSACVLDDNGYVYGGWPGWNPIEKVINWKTLTEEWQQSTEGGACHPWASTRGSNYIYFLRFRENQNGDVYRLTATGTGASASQAATHWKNTPWDVGMGCAIEYVPASFSSSGHEELWVLRGTDITTGDGQGGGATDDFAIYDLTDRSWMQFDLPHSYGLGSDMERVGRYMYFMQGGSGTGNEIINFTEIGLNTTNRAPSIIGIGNQRIIAGYTLTRDVKATDPDGEPLILSCNTSAAPGSSFIDNGDNSGTFSWLPESVDAGVYTGIVFTATDGMFTNTDEVSIIVTNFNSAIGVYINDIYVSELPGNDNLYTLDTAFENASIPTAYSGSRIDICAIPGYYDFGTGFTLQGISNGVIGVPDINPADVRDAGETSALWKAHGQYSNNGTTNGAPGVFTGKVYELDPEKYWVINEPMNNDSIITSANFSAYIDAMNMKKSKMSWPVCLGTNQFTLIAPGGAGELLDEGMVSLLMSTERHFSYTNNTKPSVVTMEDIYDGGTVLDVGIGGHDEWEVSGHYPGDEYFFGRPSNILVDSPSYEAEFYPYRITITYWNMAGDNYNEANPFGLTGFSAPGWAEQGSPWVDGTGCAGIDCAVGDTVCYLELYVEEIPEPVIFLGMLIFGVIYLLRKT